MRISAALHVLLFLLVSAVTVSAQQRVYRDYRDRIDFGDKEFYIEEGSSSSPESLLRRPFEVTEAAAFEALGKLNPRRFVWMRTLITNKDTLPGNPHVMPNPFSETAVYVFRDGVLVDSAHIGILDIRFMHTHKRFPQKVPLPAAPGAETELLVRMTHTMRLWQASGFDMAVYPRASFEEFYANSRPGRSFDDLFLFFFCGLALFQTIYVLFQWYLVRRAEYAYYAAYIFAVFIYFFARLSAFKTESPEFAIIDTQTMTYLNEVMLILPSFFYFRFARYFTELARTDPALGRHFRIAEFILLGGCVYVFLLQLIPNDLNKSIPIYILLAGQLLFAFHALVRIARQRRTVAWFLVGGSAFALTGHVTANVLPLVLAEPWVVAPLTVSMTGILMELAIFNTGLLFKARETEADKVEAQRSYIRELKKVQALREANIKVRDEISGDLHDDIGSTLSSIGIYSYAARQKLEKNEKEQTEILLKNIERGTAEAMNAMSELVWATNPRNDSGEKLAERIRTFAVEVLRVRDCRFVMEVAPAFDSFVPDQLRRKNILLILKEAVNNTAKYAKASKVELRIEAIGDHVFRFTYEDNGVGFDPENCSGNGMRTMRMRAADLSDTFSVESRPGRTRIVFVSDAASGTAPSTSDEGRD